MKEEVTDPRRLATPQVCRTLLRAVLVQELPKYGDYC